MQKLSKDDQARRVAMTTFMRENPSCTKDDLKISGGFSDAEIVLHAGPASEAADQQSNRRAA